MNYYVECRSALSPFLPRRARDEREEGEKNEEKGDRREEGEEVEASCFAPSAKCVEVENGAYECMSRVTITVQRRAKSERKTEGRERKTGGEKSDDKPEGNGGFWYSSKPTSTFVFLSSAFAPNLPLLMSRREEIKGRVTVNGRKGASLFELCPQFVSNGELLRKDRQQKRYYGKCEREIERKPKKSKGERDLKETKKRKLFNG